MPDMAGIDGRHRSERVADMAGIGGRHGRNRWPAWPESVAGMAGILNSI
jgi:hypothetical protein